jgi:hypothetical protein
MKKALKITGITLASLVGLVLIVAGIAVAMLTSSLRLTKMIKHYAPQFVNCEMELGMANLTLFKTFPNVGVDIEHVALINPMAGSPSDTLANIDDLTVALDIKKLLKEKKIVVRQCVLEKALVNIYIDSVGNSNLNVFNTKEDKDTTNVSFDYLVDIEEIKLKNSTMFFTNDFSHLAIQVNGFDLNLNGTFQDNDIHAELGMKVDDFNLMNYATPFALKNVNLGFNGDVTQFDQIKGVLTLEKPDIHLNINEPSMGDDTLSISLPVQFSIKQLLGHYDNGQICFKDYRLFVDGGVEIADGKIVFGFDVNSNTVALESLLPYLPEALQKELNANGPQDMLDLTVTGAKVTINPSLAPHIQIKIQADDLALNMSSLPYPFMDLNFDVLLANDLTKKTSNSIEVNGLRVKFKHSNLDVKGLVGDLSGDVLLKLNAEGDVLLSDVKNFLPETMKLKGHTNFNLATDFTVDKLKKTLEDYNLNRLSAKADLKIKNLAFDMDTIHVATPQFNVNLVLPASSKQKGKTGAYLAVDSKALEAQVGAHVDAIMKGANIRLFADNFKGGIKDVMLDATMRFGKLGMVYDTLSAALIQPNIIVRTSPEKNVKGLNARFTIDSDDVEAQMGAGYALNTRSLGMKASVRQNENKTGFLNQWNPDAELTLGHAAVKIDGLDENINVNNVDFHFNPNILDFKNCTIRLGQSDLSLQGNVIGIKDWMENHGNQMKGEFQLNTDLLNVKEIVGLINGLNITKDPKPQKAESKENSPFIVPTGIDLAIDVKTKQTVYGDLDFNDLSGTITMKDSTLILHELSFTNKAADMQLSALYQSKDKDNLFFAMDFHLLNVQVNDLLHLVPYFDTLVPMLKTFDGQCEFNIDVETNLESNYRPQISTLRAAADVKGKDLTVNDQFTFTKITDLLGVSTNGEYRVDSLDVQLAFFENKLNIWPSQIAIGKYKAVADGFMTLEKNAEFHIALTESPFPMHHGLKISGPLDQLKFKLEDSKYPNHYKPLKHSERKQFHQNLRKMIADRLREKRRP